MTSAHSTLATNQHHALKTSSLCNSEISSPLDHADDIIPLAEKREPVVQHHLLLVAQIAPFRPAILRLERGRGQSTRCVLACEDCPKPSGRQAPFRVSNHHDSFLVRNRKLRVCCFCCTSLLADWKGKEKGVAIPWYCPLGAYAAFPLTSNTRPLTATYVGRFGLEPVVEGGGGDRPGPLFSHLFPNGQDTRQTAQRQEPLVIQHNDNSTPNKIPFTSKGELTITFRQLLHADGVVFGRV